MLSPFEIFSIWTTGQQKAVHTVENPIKPGTRDFMFDGLVYCGDCRVMLHNCQCPHNVANRIPPSMPRTCKCGSTTCVHRGKSECPRLQPAVQQYCKNCNRPKSMCKQLDWCGRMGYTSPKPVTTRCYGCGGPGCDLCS